MQGREIVPLLKGRSGESRRHRQRRGVASHRRTVAALTGDGHEGHRYDITGPELIDATGFLALVNRLTDRPVERIDVDDETYERYRTDFMTDPANTGTFELFTGTGEAIRAGWLNVLSDDVRRLTGRTPTALQDMPPFAR